MTARNLTAAKAASTATAAGLGSITRRTEDLRAIRARNATRLYATAL